MSTIDLDYLFKIRLVVARFGEMDLARWWDTKGMLGKTGRLAVSRGLPKAHRFAQARAVFSVARARCREVYNPPDGVTLWDLPAEVESAFEERWPLWIENQPAWQPFFDSLEAMPGDDLVGAFATVAPLPTASLDAAKRMKRAADQKAVPLGEASAVTDELVSQLAVGFSKGEPGRISVPFATLRKTR
ncbi:MAG: BrxE family protein [Phycisphaerales bacterium]|nr:BrxE family protein [Phycisphaerales bacterium]